MFSPSSSSSLDSVFDRPNSRATTPSSIVSSLSCKSTGGIIPHAPATCVFVQSTMVDPDLVALAFNAYSQEGSLGIIVSNHSNLQMALPFIEWKKTNINIKGRTFDVKLVLIPKFDALRIDSILEPMETLSNVSCHLASFSRAGVRAVTSMLLVDGYIMFTLERPPFNYIPLSSTPSFTLSYRPSSGNVPTLQEWKNVWATWDLITLQMIPGEMLHQKPIDLRHKCLFYIGHIPTFLDMLLSKAIGGGASEPQHFWNVFERGIDPHVDDPDHCHSHSEVPEKDEDWPVLETIIGFRDRVRSRLIELYNDLQTGKRRLTRNIARTLVMTIEHEGFHIETLLYMLIQRAGTGTLPPPGFTAPAWETFTQQWDVAPAPSTSTVVLGPATVSLGHQDSEDDDALPSVAEDVDNHVFGWDNESPERKLQVAAFRAEWRPVTNGEFEAFWRKRGADSSGIPASWVYDNDELKVRTMYGPVSMEIAQHWPVLTSHDDFLAYARWKGGRLPTEAELRLFLDTYEVGHEGGSNTGFRNWHPVPATTGLECNDGKGSNGGVWEWTSTLFEAHEGLSPTKLFTGYSTDFFDTKHHVVLLTLPFLD
ncbi:hypothetical protein C0993_001930 [Termitomyces sp. T159_Od127]|nr:hypothetical protein C0993_001930 [Termitomyces sp. T159_Od127]